MPLKPPDRATEVADIMRRCVRGEDSFFDLVGASFETRDSSSVKSIKVARKRSKSVDGEVLVISFNSGVEANRHILL